MNDELSSIAAQCAEVDSLASPSPSPAPAESNIVSIHAALIGEVKMLISIGRPMLELAIPHLKGAPQDAWDALVEPIAELLRHYNITVAQLLTNPWAKLALAAVPLGMHGYQNAIAAKATSSTSSAIAAPVTPPEIPQSAPNGDRASQATGAPVVLARG
jgi:hypothetical protein